MTSVSQIVRKIIDELSDGVSELVLLVVVLAEQNAPLPEQLPPAATVVNETANTLAKVARQLAATDYSDFPEIFQEINEACDAVNSATSTLARAITILQGPGDRKQGWNGLVDACRVMSGKTIRLLQIVYGADLKRLMISAERLLDDIGGLHTGNLRDPTSQKKLADGVKDLADKAMKLHDLVRNKAKDNDSPFSRDLLNKVAQGLKDGAKDLIDAGNEALRNPDHGPKVDDAADKLRDAIKNAVRAVNDAESEPPSLNNLRKLGPLLDKAAQSVGDLPKNVRDPKGYERAEKQAKDDVDDVLKNIKPNPKYKRPAEKIEDGLQNQLKAGRNALGPKGQNDPNALPQLNKATNDLLKALNDLKNNPPERRLPPEQREEFQKALENLHPLMNKAIPKTRDNDDEEAFERLKDNIDNLKKALRDKDPVLAAPLLRQTGKNAEDLAKKMADPNKNSPYYQRQKEAADDLNDLLPRVIKKGTPALRNFKDPEVDDLVDALNRLKRAADRGMDPKDERDMRDAWKDLLPNLRQAAENPKEALQKDPGLKAIQDALKNLRKAGDRIAARHPEPDSITRPLADLDNGINNFLNNAPKAAQGDPNAKKTLERLVPEVEKVLGDLDRATRANNIAPIQDCEDAVDKVIGSIDTGKPNRMGPAIKDLGNQLGDLEKKLASSPNPQARDFGKNIMENHLKPAYRDLVNKAKEAAANPEQNGIATEANDIGNRLKHPLAELKRAIDPQPLNRKPETQGAAVKRALENLRRAFDKGDPEAIQAALDGVKNALRKYNDEADPIVNSIKDPRKRDLLNRDGDEIKELLGDLGRLKPTDRAGIKAVMDQIPDKLDNWINNLNGDERDGAIKAAAKVNNLLLTLGSISDQDMDLGDLLTTAGQLSDLMRGLIGDSVTNTARKLQNSPNYLTPAAKAALDLDKILSQINGVGQNESNNIESVVYKIIPVDGQFEKVDLRTARTFDQVLAGVAYEIHEQAKNISQEGDNLAKELATLAKAARSGDKQAMLIAAKAASGHIAAFCKQINDYSQKIPGRTIQEKREQDNLIRIQQGLRNYGTQLKILTSVKAASISESRDTDLSLTSLTRNLGEACKAALHGMVVAKEAIFRV